MKTIEKASHFAHDTVDKIAGMANQSAEAIDEKTGQLKNAEQLLMNDCHQYIRDNPVMSLGIAAAAGFMLSRLLSGR